MPSLTIGVCRKVWSERWELCTREKVMSGMAKGVRAVTLRWETFCYQDQNHMECGGRKEKQFWKVVHANAKQLIRKHEMVILPVNAVRGTVLFNLDLLFMFKGQLNQRISLLNCYRWKSGSVYTQCMLINANTHCSMGLQYAYDCNALGRIFKYNKMWSHARTSTLHHAVQTSSSEQPRVCRGRVDAASSAGPRPVHGTTPALDVLGRFRIETQLGFRKH